MLPLVFTGLSSICGLVILVCWILVVVAMFKHDKTALGILSIVLCGIGALIAFVFGWQQHREWNLTKVMTAWTVAIIAAVIFNVLTILTAPPMNVNIPTEVKAFTPPAITTPV